MSKEHLGVVLMKEKYWEFALRDKLGLTLYRHSLSVKQVAIDLARCYGANTEKASIAGILHDYGKAFSHEDLLRCAHKWGMEIDEVTLNEPDLLHAPVGARLIQKQFNINDKEVLEAVEVHTTGRKGMGLLAKIIYLADYIEVGRNYPGVERLRELAFKDLDKAVLTAVEQTISYVLKRGRLIHPNSIFLRNSLVSKQKTGGV